LHQCVAVWRRPKIFSNFSSDHFRYYFGGGGGDYGQIVENLLIGPNVPTFFLVDQFRVVIVGNKQEMLILKKKKKTLITIFRRESNMRKIKIKQRRK